MLFIFLPEQNHRLRKTLPPLTRETLPDGVFYPIDDSSAVIVLVPHGCAPVKCFYSGDRFENHSWTNPVTGQFFEDNHPSNLEVSDGTFYDSFYEITKIKCLTFGEEEAWCSDTNQKIRVEKTNVRSIWNPFFQRYDQQCDCLCFRIGKVKKEMDRGSYMYFDKFTHSPELFFDVYCNCGMRDNRSHHTDSDSD
jgi:hypothetical protein